MYIISFSNLETDGSGSATMVRINQDGTFLTQHVSFMLKNTQGDLIVPIRERLFITIQDSFISDTPCC